MSIIDHFVALNKQLSGKFGGVRCVVGKRGDLILDHGDRCVVIQRADVTEFLNWVSVTYEGTDESN